MLASLPASMVKSESALIWESQIEFSLTPSRSRHPAGATIGTSEGSLLGVALAQEILG